MIYLDNAATTFPKPYAVLREMHRCMESYCGNPGRSAHALSLAAAEKIYDCRCEIAELFGSDSPERVVFTYNTTYALNMAIKSVARPGDHVLISELEHNSVLRPVVSLASRGIIEYSTFSAVAKSTAEILESLKKLLRPNTRILVCTHASNICPIKLPVREIGLFCKKHGMIFILDAAQSAGTYDIDMKKMNISVLCAPGHKGLYGPQGTGIVLFSDGIEADTFIEGGNGINSLEHTMPDFLPERYEAGTLATPAIIGLMEGVRYIKKLGLESIRQREYALASRLADMLASTKGVTLYAPELTGPTLLFNIDGRAPNKVCERFDKEGICLRGGFHCSPTSHAALGTGEMGAVRASLGLFNNDTELEIFYKRLKEIVFTA